MCLEKTKSMVKHLLEKFRVFKYEKRKNGQNIRFNFQKKPFLDT